MKELGCEIMGESSETGQFPDLRSVAGTERREAGVVWPNPIQVAIWRELTSEEEETYATDVQANANSIEALKVCKEFGWTLISEEDLGLYIVNVPEEVINELRREGYIEREVEIDGKQFGVGAEWPD